MPAQQSTVPSSWQDVDPAWAWAPFEPNETQPWSLRLSAHLHRRAGFGASWTQLQESVAAGCLATVDRLIAGGPETSEFYATAEKSASALAAAGNAENLPAWWLYVMLYTPHPLLEKMTLFWHGHFATSAAKVTDVRQMLKQNELLRQQALGSFTPLLDSMAKDPAMLIWLDSTTNRKLHPNENFGREVMELFSLGLGQYTERDIKEAARAFTGWELRQGAFRFNRQQHDPGDKTLLGETGAWTGDDVLRILLSKPAAAQFLTRKLFRYLVSESVEPTPEQLAPLAAGLQERQYDIAWLTRTILSSNVFYSPFAVRQKIKAPVEFAIGLLRGLEGSVSTYALAGALNNLGQAVFFPPNVKGWDGGRDWINSSTLLARANLVWDLVTDQQDQYKSKVALERLSALDGLSDPAAMARRLVDLLLSEPVSDAVGVQLAALAADGSGGERLRRARLVQAIGTLPEFQLA